MATNYVGSPKDDGGDNEDDRCYMYNYLVWM